MELARGNYSIIQHIHLFCVQQRLNFYQILSDILGKNYGSQMIRHCFISVD